jgi:DNA-binding transcriptional regulator YhcF (GntR family)
MTTVLDMPTVDRSPPPTQQITSHYREEIRAGRLAPGDELPANRRMASEWGVSTRTALRAVQLLVEEGLIATRPGKPPVIRKNTEKSTDSRSTADLRGRMDEFRGRGEDALSTAELFEAGQIAAELDYRKRS